MTLAQSKKAYADKQQVNDKVLLRVRDQLFVYAALCSSVLVIHMQDCILVLSICEHISSSSVMACCQYLPGNYDPSTMVLESTLVATWEMRLRCTCL